MNFSFIASKDSFNKTNNLEIITQALSELNISDIKITSHHDLVMLDKGDNSYKKISGSAFREAKHKALHHGTLLVNANLENLSGSLKTQMKFLSTKGVSSRRSKVRNIVRKNSAITFDAVTEQIIKTFVKTHNLAFEYVKVNRQKIEQYQEVVDHCESLQSWDWKFGKTLGFEYELQDDKAGALAAIAVDRGLIQSIKFYDNAMFDTEFTNQLTTILVNNKFTATDITECLQNHFKGKNNLSSQLQNFCDLVMRYIPSPHVVPAKAGNQD